MSEMPVRPWRCHIVSSASLSVSAPVSSNTSRTAASWKTPRSIKPQSFSFLMECGFPVALPLLHEQNFIRHSLKTR